MKLEDRIRYYFENLNPKNLNLREKIVVSKVKHLGMGASNLNYLVIANKRKFIFRLNIDKTLGSKTRKEYDALLALERYKLGPKVYLIDESRKIFGEGFIILEYMEGKPLSEIKNKLTSKIIRELARIVAELHNVKSAVLLRELKKYFVSPQDYLREILEYRAQFNELRAPDKLIEVFDATFRDMEEKYRNVKFKEVTCLIHGDIQEQNILLTKKGLRLIDFESLSVSDPGTEISYIFLEFGVPWSNAQEEIFFKEYFRHRKDNSLRKRVEIDRPLRLFIAFLWSVLHILKIKRGKMHSEFAKRTDINSHVRFARKQIKRALGSGILDKKYKNLKIEEII